MLLSVLLIGAVTLLILQQWNLKEMNQQLQQIIQHFGTNETLRTNLPGKDLNRFATNINRMIELFKKEEQRTSRNNRELKQEITNISHDIRTPLTSIKGFSQLLQDPELGESERQEYLTIIQKKVATLLRTADLFYEISQLDSEDDEPQLTEFLIGDVLVESLLAFQKDFEAAGIAVSIDETNLFEKVFADKKGTERIILNLIQNALRYAKTTFRVTLRPQEGYLLIKAENDAAEMTEEEVRQLFQRSFTIDQSRQKGQTGLGLYIVKKLAERQGGTVKAVYSEGVFSLEVALRLRG